MTDHLSPRARQQLETLDTEARCVAMEEMRWIGYPAAAQALTALSKVRERGRSIRTMGVAICSPYRNGKTMVADKFLRTATVQVRPTYYFQVPTAASRLDFLTGMIRAMGRVPDTTQRTIEGRRQQVEDLLSEHEPRVVIFDDAHHGFSGTGAKDFHTLLRVMGQRWDMSPVLIGDRSLAAVIHADGELSTRLVNCPLRRWEYGEDYARLLNSLVAELPLRRESELTEEPLAKAIFRVSEGLIGEIVQNITATAAAAVRSGDERITLALFKAMDFAPPSRRFSTAELRGLA